MMFLLGAATIILSSSVEALLMANPSNFALRNFPEPVSMSSECYTFDESHYCKMIVLDLGTTIVAESHKCECPANFRCPTDTEDTKLHVHCLYDNEKQWSKCYLPCTPIDL